MRRALLSVTDKQGIVEFARGLADAGFGLLSTGGTARTLADAGVETTEVADYTGFPELMDGRLKTLHPKVHGGLLGRRDDDGHRAAMAAHQIDPIDVLCVNLYRFRETVKKPGITRQEIVEQIDIGGPAMIRSAAKNHHAVAVVVDPADYPAVLRSLRDNGGTLPAELLRKLAAKAFAHTAAYDAAIAQWFDCERRTAPGEQFFAGRIAFSGEKLQDLRYGENPHQKAAFYTLGEPSPSLANSKQLGGKELSYNNILDADAALALALEFDRPVCVLVKHNNPCGTAVAPNLPRAFELALSGDPVSAFGGILATNRTFDVATAAAIVASGTFLEVIVAPHVEPAVVEVLQQAKWGANVRVLDLGGVPDTTLRHRFVARPVSGGFLLQTADFPAEAPRQDVATKRAPSDAERTAMAFAWKVCKHVKSNAIVLARAADDGACYTVGVGAGQMSRVDSAKIAVDKAGDRSKGCVVASDAFFPFADGLLVCAKAGATAAIQPGGSKRDQEVVEAADEHGMAMVMTGQRHFRH
ncbi:MAG: bifunctional phosphoribosylaminoimidazolecarboxamide formyltransferase/IMP cyclohydrolase [Planctomycetes bacterium]|jgi:phosphoribosylaminoimidazolecarboxamide formyltransferase/IMP cyclohydrolase|nr:bifunctional phosphoribosylaminoimidazolecarboxamide formyltransferase/IMP cyclohydrolase [Planctomycetota bacterium]